MIPYGRQSIDDEDIQAVVDVLKSDYITTGPKINEFETAVAEYSNVKYGVAVSNGTAALHAAMFAIDIKPGDEVIVSPLTFAASVNCVLYQGGTPIFADVSADSLLIDPTSVERKITERTKAVIAVDYAGQPCDYDSLRKIASAHNLVLVADSCHAIGAEYKGRKTGSLADLTVFSFHPVKHITTGEGGMVVTNNEKVQEKIRLFRNHGITTDYRQREEKGDWFYEMELLGFNYRITDFQCALGINQLKKLPQWLKRRREIATYYNDAFNAEDKIVPLKTTPDVLNAYHLYVVRLLETDRNKAFAFLRKEGIGVNVHYIPVHLHPYYKNALGTGKGLCPIAEAAYEKILSLPMYPGMSDENVQYVIDMVNKCTS